MQDSRAEQQKIKIAAVREALSEDWEELETKLTNAGEFRGDEKFDDVYLRRWLRTHQWKVEVVIKALREHVEWRHKMCPNAGRIEESFIAKELAAKKIYTQGTDNEGRGFGIVVARLHDGRNRDADELERLMIYSLDKQKDIADITKNPFRRTSVLFDLSKMSFVSIDLTIMRLYYSLLANHFVDTFGKIYLFDAPTIFWATWTVFSPIIPKEAMKMIKFIYPKDLRELHADVPSEVLPKDYGGNADFILVQDYKI